MGGYEPSFSILIEKVSAITDRRKEKIHVLGFIIIIKNKNSPTSLGCGMNCKIHVTSVVGGETVSPTDRK